MLDGRWSIRTVSWFIGLTWVSTDNRFCTEPLSLGRGTRFSNCSAMGSRRVAGMRLPANGVHVPSACRVSGSQSRASPEKSP